ncbi:hypothetical protein Tco_0833041, partial [Tanacetum coccineum]
MLFPRLFGSSSSFPGMVGIFGSDSYGPGLVSLLFLRRKIANHDSSLNAEGAYISFSSTKLKCRMGDEEPPTL